MESSIKPQLQKTKELVAKQAGLFTAKLLPEKVDQDAVEFHLEMSLRISLKKAEFQPDQIGHLWEWIETPEAAEATITFADAYRKELS